MTEKPDTKPSSASTESPAVSTDAGKTSSKKKLPSRGNRYRLFDDGDGDYRIYQIAPGTSDFPTGTLLPIPGVPGFDSVKEADAYIDKSEDTFQRMQIMILKGCDIIALSVETTTKVRKNRKPKNLIK